MKLMLGLHTASDTIFSNFVTSVFICTLESYAQNIRILYLFILRCLRCSSLRIVVFKQLVPGALNPFLVA